MITDSPLYIQTARDIVHSILGVRVRSAEPVTVSGLVNQTVRVMTAEGDVIARLNSRIEAPGIFEKETQCLELATRHGIPSPRVLAVGKREETAFMLQEYVEGTNGQSAKSHERFIWGKLGEYARRIHSIKVEGFGSDIVPASTGATSPVFSLTRENLYNWELENLFNNTRLFERRVLNHSNWLRIYGFLSGISKWDDPPVLCHGDLKPQNTLIKNNKVTLLDWGNAQGNFAPAFDIGNVHGWSCQVPADCLNAFHEGYGLSRSEVRELKPRTDRIALLRVMAALHWAVDNCPQYVDYFTQVVNDKINEVIPAHRLRSSAAISKLPAVDAPSSAHQMALLRTETSHK